MRYSLYCALLLPLLFTIPFPTDSLLAQPIDSVRPVVIVDSTRISSSLYYTIGVTPMAVENLNTFLAESGFGENRFAPDFLDGKLAFGAGVRADVGQWMLTSEFSMVLPEGGSRNGTWVGHSSWQIQASGGYLAASTGNLLLYPMAGLGVRFNRMTINENQANSFQNLFDSAGRAFAFSNQSLHIELGAGTEYSFPWREDERSVSSIAVGFRGGYLIGLDNAPWRVTDGGEISGGPDVSPSGLQIALTIGLRTQPRVYDATIVAERPPTSDMDHSSRLSPVVVPEESAAPEPGIRYGLKAGFTRAYINDPDSLHIQYTRWLSSRDAPTGGIFASIPLAGPITLQPELLFVQKGGEFFESSFGQPFDFTNLESRYTLTTRYNADYIETPLLLKLRGELGSVFAVTLLGGVYGSLLTGSSIEHEKLYGSIVGSINREEYTETLREDFDIDSFDAGTVFGFGFDLTLWEKVLSVEMRGWRGFSNISNADDLYVRSQGAVVMAGYRF